MALFLTTLEFRDADGHTTTRNFYVEAADQAAATTRLQALAAVISDVLAGAIEPVGYIRVPVALSDPLTYKLAADAGSEVEIVAEYTIERVGSGTATLSIPGFDKEGFSTSDVIDRADPAIVALETELLDQGWADYRGGDFTSVLQAIVNFYRK